jgi:hypothetical protein
MRCRCQIGAEINVHCGCNDKEEPEASHADSRGEFLCVVETRALTATLCH